MNKTIIRVSFFISPNKNGKLDFFFGSLSAIYDSFTEQQIGDNLQTLQKMDIDTRCSYATKNCTISEEIVRYKINK